jgi:WD40 repeat protein
VNIIVLSLLHILLRRGRATGTLIALCISLTSGTAAADPSNTAPKQNADALGDPLPFGAILRMGTTRLHNKGSAGLAFSPDGKTVYSASYGIFASAVPTGKQLEPFKESAGMACYGLALSPDGKTLATAGPTTDKALCLWDVPTRALKANLKGHAAGTVWSVCFSPDGKLLVSGGGEEDGAVRVWDIASGTELHKWETGLDVRGNILSAVFSPDGRYVAASNQRIGNPAADFIRLWELKEGKQVWQTEGPPLVSSLQFTPDGKRLYAGGAKGVVWVLDTANGKRSDRGKLAGCPILLANEGKTLISVSPEEGMMSVRVCDAATGDLVRKLAGHGSYVKSLAVTGDGKTLASASYDGSIILWDMATGQRRTKLPGHEYLVQAVTYSPDGKTLATLGGDHTVRLWDAQTGKELHCLDAGPKRDFIASEPRSHTQAQALVFSPTGRVLAAPGPSGTVYFWDPATGQELARLEGHQRMPTSLVFAPDGKLLASGDQDGRIVLWSINDRREACRLEVEGKAPRHDYGVMRLAISPDGKTLVAGCVNEALRIWDLDKKRLRATYRCWATDGLFFCDDGLLLAAGDLGRRYGDSALVRFLLMDNGEEFRRLTLMPGDLQSNCIMGRRVTFVIAPDGRSVAAVGDASPVVHWYERATNREIARFDGHDLGLLSVAFSPDGRFMATAGRDHTALVWDLFRAVSGAEVSSEEDWNKNRANELWAALGENDPAKAYKAMSLLASKPERGVALCKQHLSPVKGKQRQTVEQLIDALNDDVFEVREAASQELIRRGPTSVRGVQGAINKSASVEAEKRLRQILVALHDATLNTDTLCLLRAIQFLEIIGSGDARAVLQSLAGGAPDASLTVAARAALERLRKR